MSNGSSGVPRRAFIGLAGALGLQACSKRSDETAAIAPSAAASPAPSSERAGNADLVRVASVKTAVEGNVLPELIADFEKASRYRVELTPGESVYTWAREGKADLVVSHYGHREAEDFVLDGSGEWPRTIFSNQMALVGPPSDPARVRGLEDAGEAFRRIAASKSTFVLNDIDGVRYLTEILWNAAGKPDRSGWFHDEGHRKDGAIERASDMGAYAFWGLTPFLRLDGQKPLALEPLVLADPLLQRLMVSVVVKPSKVPGANADGARALQAHLLAPSTQARIRSIRYPGDTRVSWVPAGRNNRSALLPKG